MLFSRVWKQERDCLGMFLSDRWEENETWRKEQNGFLYKPKLCVVQNNGENTLPRVHAFTILVFGGVIGCK
jgi:hypothetical protein